MSKNKELVAEAIAAIPLWIAFLDKKEAEQDALLAEMQGKKKTFMQKIASRFKKGKKESEDSSLLPEQEESLDSSLLPANESLDNDSETPNRSVRLEKEDPLDSAARSSRSGVRRAPKTTDTNQNTSIAEEEDEDEDEDEENQYKELF